ncbi:hypothetical protein MP228_007552 [Amoeboaphelidium protococcarum]|nr:hypothetical protein MP228_007552 [Amoeboaphelidium protococcarum]
MLRCLMPYHVLDCVYAFDAIEQIKKFWNQNSTEHILELRDQIRTLPFADDSKRIQKTELSRKC